jgi:1,4-dihydroxy-2-naphthoyl-CoA synthase
LGNRLYGSLSSQLGIALKFVSARIRRRRMSYENIIYEKRGPIAYVTLDRPDKLNALSEDL